MGTTDLWYPHEHAKELTAAYNDEEIARFVPQAGRMAIHCAEMLVGMNRLINSPEIFARATSQIYELCTGHLDGVELTDKSRFGQLMRDTGYYAPKSVLVHPDEENEDLLEKVCELDVSDNRRFLKPLWGASAIGTGVAPSPETALSMAASKHNAYLIQAFAPAAQVWSYTLHRDARQVRAGERFGWRICFQKLHTYMFEAVTRPIGRLVGARLPDGEERQNLDAFMLRLAAEVEQNVGRPLPTMSFDLGTKAEDTLRGTRDHEELRQNIVIYEFQLPLGHGEYFFSMPRLGRYSLMYRSGVMARFMRSMIASGMAMRSQLTGCHLT